MIKLKEILIVGEPYSQNNIIAPTTSGYSKATIQFNGDIQVKSDIPMGANNTAVIAPNPNSDKTQWTVIGDKGHVQVGIHLQRIWWCMQRTDGKTEWRDTAFQMSREEFYRARNDNMIVRLPIYTRSIDVGFTFSSFSGERKYQVKHCYDDNTFLVEFSLRDFCGHREIAEFSPTESLLKMQCGENECVLVRIPADVAPPDSIVKPVPNPGHPLQKGIFRPSTRNKRFSSSELHAVGLTLAKANSLRISVDSRRKTESLANIDALQKYLGKHDAN